ncbi:molybdopterin converting factor subunit 1 [Metabacillus halosaccharovorans]|uniref:Molybdopterin synthase sulfur carrier subunit n=1 Tax=Metabacillus halosaccharovorans TaxID=930124 RepID=A0ABT3DKL2_9BACI|nr:molybdopterin converting factor subunit 1 [Metabacillus halosaccharovorans]MCV9887454.1 molybdopterin converting factor subunit 1 [Metabacillus halosaccharovorans]
MIKVLLFAHLQEKVGQESISIERIETTVKDIRDYILSAYDIGNLENVMIAVNEEYALDDDMVKAGDVVALIPPVSGG